MTPVRIALSVTIIALAGAVWAQSAAESLFAEANQLYRDGAYEAAREKYQEVVEAGYVDARLFYNLGNACFKSDRLGEAIVWYERAQILSPRDEDIRANLRFAAHVIRDRDPTTDGNPVWQYLMRLYDLPSVNEVCVLLALLLLGVCALGAWRLWRDEQMGTLWEGSLLTCACLFVLVGILGGLRIHDLESRDDGVITAQEAIARSAPDADETVVFLVHEGTKVRIHRQEGPWLLIRLGNGLGGWMLARDVTVI